MKLQILADQYLHPIEEFLPPGIRTEIHYFDPENGLPATSTEADALLIRTVTKINRQTLTTAGRLTFIGTATAGTDHLDPDHLRRLDIRLAHANGCNAQAVAEYVITTLCKWAKEKNADLQQKKIGVVGCGATGSAVTHLLHRLNLHTVLYDPPKAEREPGFNSATLNKLFACDILTFHTPLTHTGPYATRLMCNRNWLRHGFDLIINVARGGVIKETDLIDALDRGQIRDVVLDVWENEPVFSDEMARKAFIATPHIAGYSKEAKRRASEMVMEQMVCFFNTKAQRRKGMSKKDSAKQHNKQQSAGQKINMSPSFAEFLWEHHQIELYDEQLRKLIGLSDEKKGIRFSKLRVETPLRREFRGLCQELKGKKDLPEECVIFDGG